MKCTCGVVWWLYLLMGFIGQYIILNVNHEIWIIISNESNNTDCIAWWP